MFQSIMGIFGYGQPEEAAAAAPKRDLVQEKKTPPPPGSASPTPPGQPTQSNFRSEDGDVPMNQQHGSTPVNLLPEKPPHVQRADSSKHHHGLGTAAGLHAGPGGVVGIAKAEAHELGEKVEYKAEALKQKGKELTGQAESD